METLFKKLKKSVTKLTSKNYQRKEFLFTFSIDLLTASECYFNWMFFSFIKNRTVASSKHALRTLLMMAYYGFKDDIF